MGPGPEFQVREIPARRGENAARTVGLSSRRKGSRGSSDSNSLAWFFAVAAFGLLGWLWWHAGLTPTQETAIPKPAPLPVIQTNTAVTAPSPALPQTNIIVPPPPVLPEGGRFVQTLFEGQVAMAREGISCGCIDGSIGSQTRGALRAFQQKKGLPISGDFDALTKGQLFLDAPVYTYFVVNSNDLTRLTTVPATWLGKSEQTRLDYETVLEMAAERGEAHIGLVRSINPGIDWTNIVAGTAIKIPNIPKPAIASKAAFVRISLSGKTIQAFDSATNLIAHAPCSIAQKVEKRPIGELHVAKIALNPNYVFNPEIFPESAEARTINRKLVIPPGPNNPVGTAWIGLDKPGYGIHGTPRPEQVGRTESHGCFRLANWNAERFAKLVWAGVPVYVEP